MTDRILDFSENATELHFQNSCLVISQEGQPPVAIPASDIGVVLASHPQIRYSQAVLAGLATAGAIFVACDQKHLPIGMLLPLNGNSVQAERFCQQA